MSVLYMFVFISEMKQFSRAYVEADMREPWQRGLQIVGVLTCNHMTHSFSENSSFVLLLFYFIINIQYSALIGSGLLLIFFFANVFRFQRPPDRARDEEIMRRVR